MLGKDYSGQDCTLARALEVVGERWTLLILRDAFYGVRRFSDFATHLDVPRAVLADRLSSLVDDGLLAREPDPARRGSEVYVLTDSGREIWPALHALTRFGDRFTANPRKVLQYVHAACGTRLDPDGSCPSCGVVPGVDDVATRPPSGKPKRDDAVSRGLSRPRALMTPLDT